MNGSSQDGFASDRTQRKAFVFLWRSFALLRLLPVCSSEEIYFPQLESSIKNIQSREGTKNEFRKGHFFPTQEQIGMVHSFPGLRPPHGADRTKASMITSDSARYPSCFGSTSAVQERHGPCPANLHLKQTKEQSAPFRSCEPRLCRRRLKTVACL